MTYPAAPADVASCVRRALSEDVGTGDLTAHLIPKSNQSKAIVVCRDQAILCGTPWFDETFKQLDAEIQIVWHFNDGDEISPDQEVCHIHGPSRGILTGERTALNFIQLLSATATVSRDYADSLKGTPTRLLDTRKTIPGLRTAQKYAVACGGGENHRMGLYDAILIKENHIQATGSIAEAVLAAKKMHGKVEVEVENLDELKQAMEAGADSAMLDNFDLTTTGAAVALNQGQLKLEASGNMDLQQLRAVAETGVDFISVGALTKNVHAIDFSMRISAASDV